MYTQNLGYTGVDIITEYTGVITQVSLHVTGCVQYGLRGKAVDGVIPRIQWFDTSRIVIRERVFDSLQENDV